MKAAGRAFEEVDDSSVVRLGWDAALLEGVGPVHVETAIHTSILSARPEVGSVVHTHAPAVSAFASLEVSLRPISHDAVLFAEVLPGDLNPDA